ncbi:hypothetical protein J4456_03930 [Candidatus Pacearchaeota archaeon]|nr:hypothetical protein [Candidatus Pacearchaeota archaeon]
METQQILLGETDITTFITPRISIEDRRKSELTRIIEETEKSGVLQSEKLPLQLLKIERENYPEIDLSFLSMSSTLQNDRGEIKAPRFSVYSQKDDFNKFYSEIEDQVLLSIGNFYISFYVGGNSSKDEIYDPFGKLLIQSFNFRENLTRYNDYHIVTPTSKQVKSFRNYVGGKRKTLNLSSEFNGILPTVTKEKIKIAKSIFPKQVYLFAETKPDEWGHKEYSPDPLIVGVSLDNRTYLVDHFNTTKLEDYVRREFLK